MDNQIFEINIHIHAEEELYNPFDASHLTVSDDLVSYILDKYKDRSVGEQLILNVESNATFDEKHFETAVMCHMNTEINQLSKTLRINMIKAIRLIIIGLIFVIAGILLAIYLNQVALSVISTVGSFSIWEAANILIVKNPELRLEKRRLEWLKNLKIKNSSSSDKM